MGFKRRSNRQPSQTRNYDNKGWKPKWKTDPKRILGAGEPRKGTNVGPEPYPSTTD